MDLDGICEKIATAAGNATSTPPLQVASYVPDSIVPPLFFVAEPSIDYAKTFGKTAEIELLCRLLVGRAVDKTSQKLLKKYLSTGNAESVKDAIEAARGGPGQPALDGLADDLYVQRQQGYRWYEHPNGTWFVGAELIVKVVE